MRQRQEVALLEIISVAQIVGSVGQRVAVGCGEDDCSEADEVDMTRLDGEERTLAEQPLKQPSQQARSRRRRFQAGTSHTFVPAPRFFSCQAKIASCLSRSGHFDG